MTDSEKVQIRLNCLIEASKLKQNPTTQEELKDKSVTNLAKELYDFVVA